MYTIFLVEDDPVIAQALQKHLQGWGHTVVCVKDFANVTAEFAAASPQLVLLDIGLPFFNGYHWCAEIRRLSKVPIVFLSSAADSMNIVLAMNQGADDFIAKPFDLNVLTAKVAALLRRSYDFAGATPLLEHRGAVLDTASASLCYQGQTVGLTKNEFKILQLLLEQKGRVVPRTAIMERLWATDSFIDDNTLTVNIARLRKTLDELGLVDFILTKKNLGYLVEQSDG